MTNRFSRRSFVACASASMVASHAALLSGTNALAMTVEDEDKKPAVPREAAFERDYEPPKFKPSWKNEQINRQMAADFVIYAHSDLKMVEKLLQREPGLLNATLDWGAGDWETALGGASHMGRRDIVDFLLAKGARMDIFCATMLGLLPVVQGMMEQEPTLIDIKGPHGFGIHFHAQVGQENAKPVLDYLQSIKEVKLRPVPFLRKKKKNDSESGEKKK